MMEKVDWTSSSERMPVLANLAGINSCCLSDGHVPGRRVDRPFEHRAILLTYAGLIARYDQMSFLEKLREETSLWWDQFLLILVPGDSRAELDGKAIPLLSTGATLTSTREFDTNSTVVSRRRANAKHPAKNSPNARPLRSCPLAPVFGGEGARCAEGRWGDQHINNTTLLFPVPSPPSSGERARVRGNALLTNPQLLRILPTLPSTPSRRRRKTPSPQPSPLEDVGRGARGAEGPMGRSAHQYHHTPLSCPLAPVFGGEG